MLKMFVKKRARNEGCAGGVWQAAYIVAALSIVLSIKWLSSPVTARRGVMSGELGLLFAIIGTLLRAEVVNYEWILVSIAIGAAIGAPLAYLMPMTAVPQLTALSHAFGALGRRAGGTAEYYREHRHRIQDDRAGHRNRARLSDLHGQRDGVRKVAGDRPHQADDL